MVGPALGPASAPDNLGTAQAAAPITNAKAAAAPIAGTR